MGVMMSELSVPVFQRGLNNLKGVLEKAHAFCELKGIDQSVLLNARLSPDMFPLLRQVQVAADHARSVGAQLANVEPKSFADNEVSFNELITRLDNVISYLDTFTAEQFEGSESRPINLKVGPYQLAFTSGFDYLQRFALPNFYFHSSMAYAILRHNGVDLGKRDFLGDIAAQVSAVN